MRKYRRHIDLNKVRNAERKDRATKRRLFAFIALSNLVRLLYVIKRGYRVDVSMLSQLAEVDSVQVTGRTEYSISRLLFNGQTAFQEYITILKPSLNGNHSDTLLFAHMLSTYSSDDIDLSLASTHEMDLLRNRLTVRFRDLLKNYHLNEPSWFRHKWNLLKTRIAMFVACWGSSNANTKS